MSWRAPISSIVRHRSTIAVAAIALLIGAPIAATVISAFGDADTISGNGLDYTLTTITLIALVAIGVSLLGAVSAALTVLTNFPGRQVFSWALVLPFAIPAYVAAYAYGDFLGPFGPIANLVGAKAMPEIRSFGGAAFVLVLMTYPYVYLTMRASFAARSSALMEAGRTLGASPLQAFYKLILPASRPAFAGGVALALMETAADYGVADYFGVKTLSVGIFRTWYGLGDLTAATQLAVSLFVIAALLTILEQISRRGQVSESSKAQREANRLQLSVAHSVLAISFCSLPFVFGFIIPTGVLVSQLDLNLSVGAGRGLLQATINTAGVAIAGAAFAMAIAIVLAYAGRNLRTVLGQLMLRVATLGYAIPGAVIAIGILSLSAFLGRTTGAAAGGLLILLYAYVARFLTAGYNAASGGLAQVNPQLDAAARILGANQGRTLRDIHWPLTRSATLAGAAIIAIDIAKELPATLLLRPFNFETLSTHIYRLASDERLADAAPAALILIALSLASVIGLTRANTIKSKSRA